MLEHILAFVRSIWTSLAPTVVVPVYQGAGVLRFGKYHRTLGSGIHWKIPFAEDVWHVDTVVTMLRLQPQTCTTKDGKGVVVTGVLKYRIADVRPYLCDVYDQRDVLIDVTMGAILSAVRASTFEELIDAPPEAKIASAVRRQVKVYGIEIIALTFTDIGSVRSIRLISHSMPEHLGEMV